MRWKSTWLLAGFAVVLFAFIMLVERRYWRPTQAGAEPLPSLVSFKAAEVTNIQLRITNQLTLRVERAHAGLPWQLTVPFAYPAHLHKIEWLLQELEQSVTRAYFTPEELKASKRSLAEFGLDVPQAALTLQHRGQRTEILFGSRTATGDMIYAQVQHVPGVLVLGTEAFARLPRTPNDWRDTALVNLIGIGWTRIEVRAAGNSFALDYIPTNSAFALSKPTPARADQAKVETLIRNILGAQVERFVIDNPRADLEPYGLQSPELELAFAVSPPVGTNDVLVVQFGKSPTNDPTRVYARRMQQTNVVLVSRSALEALQFTAADLRERHLLSFNPAVLDTIEVIGAENFTARRQTNGAWLVGDTAPFTADPETVRDWILNLATLEGAVEADVVTDFKTPYNLAPPARQYLLKSTLTNGTGSVSNRLLGQMDLGARSGERIFARRPDEQAVYSLALSNVTRLPAAAWQLQPRRVWSFTTNQVLRLTATLNERSKSLQREGAGRWNFAPGSSGILNNPFAIEELAFRLGELRAESWVARGEESRMAFGFVSSRSRVVIELKNGDKPHVFTLEFGNAAPNGLPYALAHADGQTWIFELSQATYFLLVRDLFQPLLGNRE